MKRIPEENNKRIVLKKRRNRPVWKMRKRSRNTRSRGTGKG
jgi:hypothetical protein